MKPVEAEPPHGAAVRRPSPVSIMILVMMRSRRAAMGFDFGRSDLRCRGHWQADHHSKVEADLGWKKKTCNRIFAGKTRVFVVLHKVAHDSLPSAAGYRRTDAAQR